VLARVLIISLPLVIFLGACTELKIATHTAKRITNAVIKKSQGTYKVGKPYQIQGIWYYPAVNYGYVENGIASWYGPKFHGRKTANGETFDMNDVSAAHRTLPLPSIVRVTNLNNGRAMKIKVNDRGPFAKNRIIDLSRRAAQLLGFERAGTALVKVEIIGDESRRLAMLAQKKLKIYSSIPSEKVQIVRLPGSLKPEPVKIRKNTGQTNFDFNKITNKEPNNIVKFVPISENKQIYVQVGAFVYRDLAEKMRKLLVPVGRTRVVEAVIGKRRYFRVQVGPAANVNQGDLLLDQVIASGYPTAKLIVE